MSRGNEKGKRRETGTYTPLSSAKCRKNRLINESYGTEVFGKNVGNLGIPLEVVLKFRNSGTTGKSRPIGSFLLVRNCRLRFTAILVGAIGFERATGKCCSIPYIYVIELALGPFWENIGRVPFFFFASL